MVSWHGNFYRVEEFSHRHDGVWVKLQSLDENSLGFFIPAEWLIVFS